MLSIDFLTIVSKFLIIIALIVVLILLTRVTTPDFHAALYMLSLAVSIPVSVVIIWALMDTIISGYIIRIIRGEELFYAFEYADVSTRKIMCDELEELYNSSRMRLEKYEQTGLIDEPLFRHFLPKFTESVDALEDILESWQLSMSPEFRDLLQKRIDELVVGKSGGAVPVAEFSLIRAGYL